MKQVIFLLFAVLTFFISSCSNEIEVIGVWKDIPVVYGVLDRTVDTNYIRIERAFLPPNQSAYDVAQIADSLYFDTNHVEVTMYRVTPDTFLFPIQPFWVELKGQTARDSGIFANVPAYAYGFSGLTNAKYVLEIKNNITGNVFYAETSSANSSNSYLVINPSYIPSSRPIEWVEIENDEFKFKSYLFDITQQFASIYDVGIKFHYTEFELDNAGQVVAGSEVDKVYDWKARRSFIPTGQFDVTINGIDFFTAVAGELSDVSNTNIGRCAGGIEVYIDGATQPLADYISAIKANLGATNGLYPVEPYSNVVGGFGVFASSDRLERPDLISSPRIMVMSNATYQYFSEGELMVGKGFIPTLSPCL